MGIKVILIASVIGIAVYLVRGRSSSHHLAIRRLLGLALAGSWIVAVLSPDLVTWVAHRVGVGRGTDLLLYALVVCFALVTVAQHQRIQSLDQRITTLTRAVALDSATRAGVAPTDE